MALHSLSHVIDLEWMHEAYRLTRKGGAPGIDGVVAAEYEANLETNLLSLLERVRSGSYKAPPVRRAYIPKADGTKRPLGIPTFEDKVAQRAIAMVLESIYEQDFYPCSYGFRPGRSAHQALQKLRMRGHYAYYGITGNGRRLRWYAHQVERIWQKWLSRRGQPGAFQWKRLHELLKRHPLPSAKIVHRYAVVSEALP